ncbi:uncharacterized protein LOC123684554 [Harmonia axyridis]|uniref:uncharacterized protein LOC123684554 n=1 Tax=Harmonia axyridis TaxID=115357 RepID=UPI001E2798FB|nr:uncharacterized protein LOC123684554 [Harmonia axyridis]
MLISTEKTKSLVISKDPIRCKLVVNDRIIEQVMNIKYLGVEITSDGNNNKEARQQVMKGARISGYLRDVTWKNKYLRTESKVKIYKTMVRPVLTYAAETRAGTSRIKQLLLTAEMSTLRNIVGKTRRDRIRNSAIREECGVVDIGKFVRKRRREWNDHVGRAGYERLIKIARDRKPTGRRDVGRPRKRWLESWVSTSVETP